MKKIKVLIADDIMILRQGLKAVLEQDSEIEVTALAQDGKDAYEKCRLYEPDVVLMDMGMPEYDGVYGISAIKEHFPHIRILVLTTFDDDATVENALSHGADGYILKEMEDEKVIASIKSVYANISVFSSGVFHTMRNRMAGGHEERESFKSQMEELTEREREILKLVARGHDNKEIATILCLAEGSVRNRVSRLLDKLELKDRTQLAVYAVKHGWDE